MKWMGGRRGFWVRISGGKNGWGRVKLRGEGGEKAVFEALKGFFEKMRKNRVMISKKWGLILIFCGV